MSGFKIEVILNEDVSEEEANNFQDLVNDMALEQGLGIVTVAVLPADIVDEDGDERRERENSDAEFTEGANDAG